MTTKITLEEFRHWLINPNDRGFDHSKLREPVPVPASAENDGPCGRVCNEAPELLWNALKALYYGGAMKRVGGEHQMEWLLEDLERYGVSLDSSAEDARAAGFTLEWPVEQNVDLLEEVYRHVKEFDGLPPN